MSSLEKYKDDAEIVESLFINNGNISANKELLQQASPKVVEIFYHINSVSKSIEASKKSAQAAQAMKSGMFGKTKKKADNTADAVVKTNESMAEMNDLIQEAIKFSCQSTEYSTIMIQAMSEMIANGFKNSSGEIIRLNKSGEKFATIILSQAEKFTQNHLRVEELQYQQIKELHEIKEDSNEKHDKIVCEIITLKDEMERNSSHLSEDIKRKTSEVLASSDERDELHDLQIEGLTKQAINIESKSDQKDTLHDEQIKNIKKRLTAQEKKIKTIEKGKVVISICISAISLLISILAIFFAIQK
jgi:hypothetical protein